MHKTNEAEGEGRKEKTRNPVTDLCLPLLLLLSSLSVLWSVGIFINTKTTERKKKTHPRPKPAPNPLNKQKKKITPSLPTTWQRLQCCGSARFSGAGGPFNIAFGNEKYSLTFFCSCCLILSCQPCSAHSAQVFSEAQKVTAQWRSILRTLRCLGQVTPLTAKEQSLSLTFLTLIL